MSDKEKAMITKELLEEILILDSSTGHLYWLECTGSKSATSPAGTLGSDGYVRLMVNGKRYLSHRLIWCLMTGKMPPKEMQIDHINRTKNDNRPQNLRIATPSENMRNSGLHADNKSGVKGVCWCKKDRKWLAQISIDNRSNCVGRFDSLIEAKECVMAAREKYHGSFCNHGIDQHEAASNV